MEIFFFEIQKLDISWNTNIRIVSPVQFYQIQLGFNGGKKSIMLWLIKASVYIFTVVIYECISEFIFIRNEEWLENISQLSILHHSVSVYFVQVHNWCIYLPF